jgi:predicted nucleic acid-binding protein
MTWAYVDPSCLVAVAFKESSAAGLRKRLAGFGRLLSSNLLEAEFRAALRREEDRGTTRHEARKAGDDLLSWVDWVIPSRPLSQEIRTILANEYLRGPHLWHLATALYVAPNPSELPFITLDQRQAEVARALGFSE